MVVEILNITRGLQRNSEEIMQKLPKTVNVLGVSGSDYLAAFGDKPVLEKRALAYYFDTFLKHAKGSRKARVRRAAQEADPTTTREAR